MIPSVSNTAEMKFDVSVTPRAAMITARSELRAAVEALKDLHHALAVKCARDIVRNGGNQLAPAKRRQFRKNRGADLPRHVGERVAVEKKERRAPMERFEKIEELEKS